MKNQIQNAALGGSYFFAQGWKLMLNPGLKRYIIMPILINILVIGGAFYMTYQQVGGIIAYLLSYLPSWLQWLSYVLWPLILLFVLVFFGYFFSTLANIIATPFNGLLSAKLEFLLTNNETNDSWNDIAKDMARSIKRELQNLAYYLPRLIVILLLFLVPVIGTIITPILLFLFNSWMMAIQYNDYAFDNNKVSFSTMRRHLKQDRTNNLVFGTLVNICTMIPIVNLFIMPAAVCGGTLHWVKKYRTEFVK